MNRKYLIGSEENHEADDWLYIGLVMSFVTVEATS